MNAVYYTQFIAVYYTQFITKVKEDTTIFSFHKISEEWFVE